MTAVLCTLGEAYWGSAAEGMAETSGKPRGAGAQPARTKPERVTPSAILFMRVTIPREVVRLWRSTLCRPIDAAIQSGWARRFPSTLRKSMRHATLI